MKERKERYWLKIKEEPWQEVTQEAFINAERGAGFKSKFGEGTVATGGFSYSHSGSGHRIKGRITTGVVTKKDYGWDSEFFKLATATV